MRSRSSLIGFKAGWYPRKRGALQFIDNGHHIFLSGQKPFKRLNPSRLARIPSYADGVPPFEMRPRSNKF